MMTPTVLTLHVTEEEILLTLIGTHGLKIRMTEMIMVDEGAPNLKGTLLDSLKAIEARPWSPCSLSKDS